MNQYQATEVLQNAVTRWSAIAKFLPEETLLYPAHDYKGEKVVHKIVDEKRRKTHQTFMGKFLVNSLVFHIS